MREEGSTEVTGSRVGEKLCKHKYSSYPYCYGEITTTAGILSFIFNNYYDD
jgi:zinc transporter 10